jgi:hypothetical protein
VLDGDLVRRLDVGQACYVYRGGVTFLQVKRLTGRQAEIGSGMGVRSPDGAAPAATAAYPQFPAPLAYPAARTADGGAPGPPTAPLPVPGPVLPDVSELLDEAFGERRG